jgi:hypothetical protein
MIESRQQGRFSSLGIDFLAVEITGKNSLESASQKPGLVSSILGKPFGSGVPPPPPPSESLDWRGVFKNGLQNIERLRVRGQDLDFKELTGFFASGSYTAFAMVIICFPKILAQVPMSHRAVDFF